MQNIEMNVNAIDQLLTMSYDYLYLISLGLRAYYHRTHITIEGAGTIEIVVII
jgi:hypothetical protein